MNRPSTRAMAALALLVMTFAGCFVDAGLLARQRTGDLGATRELATHLGLSDLALFTEARYTRHPVQADLHSAFQDHPLALEHFPSGSLVPPHHAPLDREAAAPD